MAIYAMSGGATGIGAAIRKTLQSRGHEVIVVDLKDADICVDLSDYAGRQRAIDGIRQRCPEGLDGFIPCAGVGPSVRPPSLIARINYFAAVAMTEGLLDLLEKRTGRIVMIASNSAPMVEHNDYIDLLLAGDEEAACELADSRDTHSAYAGSKHGICCWLRRQSGGLARRGIRINAVAPGIVQTPLSDKVLADPELGQVMKDFGDSVPLGSLGQPEQIASVVEFLLGPGADYMTGSIVFVDGGHDAMLRPDAF